MSVAFESNSGGDRNRIQPPGFSHGMWICNMSESGRFTGGNPWSSSLPVVKEEDSSSSSSIGKNSDALSGGGDSDEDDDGEVQSKDNGSLNGLNALEEVLPIKRGISTFYAGKSKSYGSLADASSVPSIQDIVKPEDAYSRKRKNMLAHNVLLDKHRKSTTDNGISKRLANSSRSSFPFGLNNNSHDNEESGDTSDSNSLGSGFSLPPLPRNSRRLQTDESSDSSPRLYCSPWRSLSLSDLQHVSAATSSITGLISVTMQQSQTDQLTNDETRLGHIKLEEKGSWIQLVPLKAEWMPREIAMTTLLCISVLMCRKDVVMYRSLLFLTLQKQRKSCLFHSYGFQRPESEKEKLRSTSCKLTPRKIRLLHSTLASGLYMKSDCKSFKIKTLFMDENGCLSRRCWLVWTSLQRDDFWCFILIGI